MPFTKKAKQQLKQLSLTSANKNRSNHFIMLVKRKVKLEILRKH